MKVVLDTNVIVSALMSKDNAARAVIRMAFDGELTPIVGNSLFWEYESVLGRAVLFEGCPFDLEKRHMFLDDILSISKWVEVHYLWRPNLRDEGDNHVMELALAGQAGMIITQNLKDFEQGDLRIIPDISVVSPRSLLDMRRHKLWQH